MTDYLSTLLIEHDSSAIPIFAIGERELGVWSETQSQRVLDWLGASSFKAEAGKSVVVPGDDGSISFVVLGLGSGEDPWVAGNLAHSLPDKNYRFAESSALQPDFPNRAAIAWVLGGYRFTRYKSDAPSACAKLVWPEKCDRAYVQNVVASTTLTRDLINTPASDLLPDGLEEAARDLASSHGAHIDVLLGNDLIRQNFPMIHAVGRASAVAPRLLDFTCGDVSAPKVTLVGKGVCFDSGGLDLKPSSAMALMKKDMGGAATVLGLSNMIMTARLPIRLRVLIPAVENAVSDKSFRPGDVLTARNGMTVEIGNTDAEGRLVLADAIAEAVSEEPELLLDCATLTGAARSALGPELPAMFTEDDSLAQDLMSASLATYDPLWRLPLWQDYRKMIDSKVADINNAGDSPFGGAITAALFLKEFVGEVPWVHIDLYAWNPTDRPGRPAGGEAMAQRALYRLIKNRFVHT